MFDNGIYRRMAGIRLRGGAISDTLVGQSAFPSGEQA